MWEYIGCAVQLASRLSDMNKFMIACAATALCVAFSTDSALSEIGSVSAVNQDMQGTPPSGAARDLVLGNQVVQNELIETSRIGSGQLLFVDQTALTVAPSSKIVLDKYLYDPASQEGEITMSMTQGALRFIGGRISKKRTAVVNTPSATIGIRGGMALIEVDENGHTRVIQIAGEFATIEGKNGGKVTLSRPGASGESGADGLATFTGIVTSEDLGSFFQKLEGQGDGGSSINSDGESETSARTQQVAAVNSEVTGGETRKPVSTSGEQPSQDSGEQQENIEQSSDQPAPPLAPPPPADLPLPTFGTMVTLPSQDGTFGFFLENPDLSSGSIIIEGAETTVVLDNPESVADPRFNVVSGTLGTWTDPGETSFENDTLDLFFPPGFFNGEIGIEDFTAVSDLNPDAPFHAVALRTEDLEGVQLPLFALLGDAPEDGGAFHRDDPGPVSPAANTADVFSPIGDDLFFAPDQGFTIGAATAGASDLFTVHKPLAGDGNLFLIGNAGETRAPDGINNFKDFPARWLYGQFGPQGLGVLEGIVQVGSNGPGLSHTIVNIDGRGIQRQPIGALDGFVSTFWGEDADHIVLSTISRERLDSLGTEGLGFEADFLQGTTFIDNFGGTTNVNNFHSAQTFTRNAGLSTIELDPLPLARESVEFTEIGPSEPKLDMSFAGIFTCEGGRCGSAVFEEESLDGDTFPGAYSVRSTRPTELEFDDATNTLRFSADLGNNGLSQAFVPGVSFTLASEYRFRELSNADRSDDFTNGTFLNDKIFGLNASGSVAPSDGAVPLEDSNSSLILASSGLVGTNGLSIAASDVDPEFVRWGWWAASVTVEDIASGINRLDLSIPSNWVAGNTFSDDIPFSGSAEYGGLAIAHRADLDGTITSAGGTFSLSYNFADAGGLFNVNVPGVGMNETLNVFENSGVGIYSGAAAGFNVAAGEFVNMSVNGAIFGTRANPIGGTGGTFERTTETTVITGIFAGDRQPE